MGLYQPDLPPQLRQIEDKPEILLRYLKQEYQRIAASIASLDSGFFTIRYRLPLKASPGMVAYFASGVLPTADVYYPAGPPSQTAEGLYRLASDNRWRYIG